MADIKAWITVNGRHVPIMEGENKATALANHFKKITKKKNEDFEHKRLNEYASKRDQIKKSYDSVRGKSPYNEIQANGEADLYMREKYGTKAWAMRQIKGRAKTKEEKYKEINKEYEDKVKEAEKLYTGKKYRPDDPGVFSDAHFYNNAIEKAFKERSERVEKERIFKTDKYKLKEDKQDKRVISGYKKPEKLTNEKVRKALDDLDGDYSNSKTVGNLKIRNYGSFYNVRRKGEGVSDGVDFDTKAQVVRFLNSRGDIGRASKETFKDTTGKASKLVVKNAYEKYMKDHPNSTMKFSTFEKTYKK